MGYLPRSPYTDALKVVVFTFNIFFKNLRWILSISLDLENPQISQFYRCRSQVME